MGAIAAQSATLAPILPQFPYSTPCPHLALNGSAYTRPGGGLPSPSASPPCTPPSLCSSQEPEDTIRDSSPSPLPVGPPPQSLADAPRCGHRITVGNFSLQDSSKRPRAPPPRHGACTGQGNRVTGCTPPRAPHIPHAPIGAVPRGAGSSTPGYCHDAGQGPIPTGQLLVPSVGSGHARHGH